MAGISCIYKITNLVNNKVYIGQTVNFKIRKRHHFNALRGNRHSNNFLQKSFNHHGEGHFIIEIIEETINLDEREEFWIAHYNSTDINYGYNLLTGGAKFKMNAYTKERISEGIKRFYKNNPAARVKVSKMVSGEGNPFYGRKHSEETIAKILKSRAWYRPSEETKKLMSETRRGENHPNYGKKFSDEWRKNLSEAHKGIEAANKKHFTDEQRNEIKTMFVNGATQKEIAAKFGISTEPIIRVLQEEGVYKKAYTRKTFSEEEIKRILKAMEEGRSLRSLAKEYNISPTGLSKKLKKYKK